jgi:hypothetical protein
MLERLPTTWLRPALTILGLAGLLALSACGGGSGAPNNPYVTPPTTAALSVQPSELTAYSGVPVTLTITSGVVPFSVFTANASVLPVSQAVSGNTIVLLPNKVSADTDVIVTVQDSAGQTQPVKVKVAASPIFNSLTFAPSGGDCGADLCSGQTGTMTVVATGPGGSPLVARQIRFDVVFGPVGITTTNPASPLVQTQTVATDSTGTAVAGIKALTNSTTQPAQIRATDVTSGQLQISNFTVVNSTVAGQSPLTVLPSTATITSALASACSTGFRVDYYIYGGSPPYTIASTFPQGVVLVNTTVFGSGGFFGAITNGTCVNPLQFAITDSAGKTTSATLVNEPGTGTPPAPTPLVISPATVTGGVCTGKTFRFVITGGSPSYNVQVSPTGPVATPAVVAVSGGFVDISGTFAVGTTTITIIDTAVPQQVKTATIACT